MADAKPKKVRYVTPKGVAVYPWLNNPDTKFKEQGEYRITLRVPAEEAQPLIDKLQPQLDDVVSKAQKDPKRKGKKLTVHDFYKTVYDEDGNETGEVEFKFKMTATGTSAKTGKPWAMKPDLFDAKGQPLGEGKMIFGGSVCKVSFTATPFDKPIGIGLSLRLEAVQVIKLNSGSRDASGYGFGAEDTDDEDEDSPNEETTTEESSGDDGEEDF